jgi:hypothetical protein
MVDDLSALDDAGRIIPGKLLVEAEGSLSMAIS